MRMLKSYQILRNEWLFILFIQIFMILVFFLLSQCFGSGAIWHLSDTIILDLVETGRAVDWTVVNKDKKKLDEISLDISSGMRTISFRLNKQFGLTFPNSYTAD